MRILSILSGTGKDYGVIQYSKKYEDIKSSLLFTLQEQVVYLKLEYHR